MGESPTGLQGLISQKIRIHIFTDLEISDLKAFVPHYIFIFAYTLTLNAHTLYTFIKKQIFFMLHFAFIQISAFFIRVKIYVISKKFRCSYNTLNHEVHLHNI
jgi:hypothetical protein